MEFTALPGRRTAAMPPSLTLNRDARRPEHGRAVKHSLLACAKRTADLIAGALMVLLTLPLSTLTALIVRLSGPGPLFHSEPYVGADGEAFVLLTFRNRVGAFRPLHPGKLPNLGGLIYRIRFDQLPLLLNLIRGDLTLVGPCPQPLSLPGTHRPSWLDAQLKLGQKPGLTGWFLSN